MHASIVKVRISAEALSDPEMPSRRLEFVETSAQAPGFMAGYWLQPTDGVGIAVVIWESESAATAVNETMGVSSGAKLGPGATVESVEVIPVWAHATV